MGVNFVALMGHNLDEEELYALPMLLNSTWSQAQQFLPVLEGLPAPGSAPDEWRWHNTGNISLADELKRVGRITMDSPDCFIGHVGMRSLDIYHLARWWSFLTDEAVRRKLQGACRHIAVTLGSARIAYIPDSSYKPELARGLINEGKTIDEIVEWLRANCGPPAADIGLILRQGEEGWNGSGYYVEVLREPPSRGSFA